MAVPKSEMSAGVKWECEQLLESIREHIQSYEKGERTEADLRSLVDWFNDVLPDLDVLLMEDED